MDFQAKEGHGLQWCGQHDLSGTGLQKTSSEHEAQTGEETGY